MNVYAPLKTVPVTATELSAAGRAGEPGAKRRPKRERAEGAGWTDTVVGLSLSLAALAAILLT